MSTEHKTCDCGNTYTRGIQCRRCDAISYVSFALDEIAKDGMEKVKLIDKIVDTHCQDPLQLVDWAKERDIPAIKAFAIRAKLYTHAFDLQDRTHILECSIARSRWRACREVGLTKPKEQDEDFVVI